MKSILQYKYFLFLFFNSIFSISYSQQTVGKINDFSEFNSALSLYNDEAYPIAQKIFTSVIKKNSIGKNLKLDALYYDAVSSINLNKKNAVEKMLTFIKENPNSNNVNKAYFDIANYNFSNKKTAAALKWYKKVNTKKINTEELKELNFKMGYCYLISKKYDLAKNKFIDLINDTKYGNDSRYYYGYIAYITKEYSLAETTLQEIEESKTYNVEVSYYLLDINYKLGNFEKCIEIGKNLLQKTHKKQQSDISKIIGESYFNLKNYAEAIPYLKAYKGKKGRWINTDYYQIGYAHYKQNNFTTAIGYFNKIVDEQNEVAQNAYYHLGKCYLKINKKSEALNAFRSSSEMNFNKKIKEDASLNYTKLSYETGNAFEKVANVLKRFLKNYPKSNAYDEINSLLITSYIHQQDFKGALEYLSESKTKQNNALILEVSLYRGIKLYNEKKIKMALPFFSKAKNSDNIKIKQKASYWEAECNFKLKNYETSINQFITLQKTLKTSPTSFDIEENNFALINYNIGYNYFNLKQYESAIPYFYKFSNTNSIVNKKVKADGITRLGDCYYALKKYDKAISAYEQTLKNFDHGADYAAFQAGIVYGIINKPYLKIKSLNYIVNNYETSNLTDDALFEIAATYIRLKETDNAHSTFNQLLKKHPFSVLTPKTLVRQGLLYYNSNNNDKALSKFKEVAERFPKSQDAYEAVTGAKNIYIDKGDLDEYVEWTKSLNFIDLKNSDIDNTSFELAEKTYFESNKTEKIIENLTKYLRKFPKGIHVIKANYYLGETYFKNKDFNKSIKYYNFITNQAVNIYSEDALIKLSTVYLKDNKIKNALPLLKRLEKEANETKSIFFAKSNLMKGYFDLANYNLAIKYGNKVLKAENTNDKLKNDSKKIIARSFFKIKDFKNAEYYYTEINKTAKRELKAEILYHLAFFKRNQKDYEASNKIVQDLIANYSSYKYWAVKSYVLMGKNYASLNDIYQATFVLENVIKNFSQFEDIIFEAKKALTEIKAQEAKKNESIKP